MACRVTSPQETTMHGRPGFGRFLKKGPGCAQLGFEVPYQNDTLFNEAHDTRNRFSSQTYVRTRSDS